MKNPTGPDMSGTMTTPRVQRRNGWRNCALAVIKEAVEELCTDCDPRRHWRSCTLTVIKDGIGGAEH